MKAFLSRECPLTIDYETPQMSTTNIEFLKTVREYARSLENTEKLYPHENKKLLRGAIEAVISLVGHKLSLEMLSGGFQTFSATFNLSKDHARALLLMSAVIQVSFP